MNRNRTLSAARFSRAAALVGLCCSAIGAQTVAHGTWKPMGSLAATRWAHTAVRLPNQEVLVTGGFGSCDVSAGNPCIAAEVFSPLTGMWTPTGSMAVPRAFHTTTLLRRGLVLAAGGFTASAELYNPAIGAWTTTGTMVESRWSHAAARLADGRVLVSGGIDENGHTTASAEIYDPATGMWTATGPMGVARAGHTLSVLRDGRVLASGAGVAATETYDPAAGVWTPAGPMSIGRNASTATLLPSGLVLVTGGENETGLVYYASAELFDPSTGLWTLAGSMAEARGSHTATLLPTGKVLVAGGVSACFLSTGCYTTADAELYDPATGQWSATGAMPKSRGGHTATLLGNGAVLVTAGTYQQDFQQRTLKDTAVYIP